LTYIAILSTEAITYRYLIDREVHAIHSLRYLYAAS
jgi:hypothetical protein